jgi:hypothetical protein
VFVLIMTMMAWGTDQNSTDQQTIKVFVLAGDECVLEQGAVQGRTQGVHEDFFPNAEKTDGEKRKHVNAAVYAVPYASDVNLDALSPVVEAEVEIGDQRTRRIHPKKRGREPVPMTPFPDVAMQPGHTTVLHGYLSVQKDGRYELHPGEDDSAFNVTTLDGNEVYRRELGAAKPQVTPVQLNRGKRYAFKTVFFKNPGHAFRLPMIGKPGTLSTVVEQYPKYTFLKDADGNWVSRDDVVLYDAHPIHNNTEAPAHPISVGVEVVSGGHRSKKMGVDLMLSHRLGRR